MLDGQSKQRWFSSFEELTSLFNLPENERKKRDEILMVIYANSAMGGGGVGGDDKQGQS